VVLKDNKEIQSWLSEYHNRITKRNMRLRIKDFLNSINMSPEDFIKLSSKEAKHIVLQYQAKEKAKGTPNNTILSNVTAPRALFKYLEKPLALKGKLVKIQRAQNRHYFSNGDLSKMFDVADIRGKAMIATASSLGWAMSDFRSLERNKIETLIARAKDNNEQFVYFKHQRRKTGAESLGVLNPLSIEWLSKWFAKSKGEKIFDLSADMINKDLQRFAEEAQIKTTGNVSFHAFRAWTFTSLVKAGLSEFECKYLVGKTIPLSDSTYLINLEEQIKKKYPAAYNSYLNIKPALVNPDERESISKMQRKMEHINDELGRTSALLEIMIENVLTPEQKEKLKKVSKEHFGDVYPL